MSGADTTPGALAAIRSAHENDRVLPGVAYRDADVYEAEVASIFHESWISVACGQNVPEPGDLFPVWIAGHTLLVLRDESGEVRVYYNMCRHRGAQLVAEPCRARRGRIVCPYHAWAYGLDGALAFAPHFYRDSEKRQPEPGDRAALGLLPLRTAVWRDVVLVNLSGTAPPFEEFIRPLDERLAAFPAEELRPLASDEYVLQANWKLAAENFLDVYHLPVVHPQIPGGFAGALHSEDIVISDDVVGVVMLEGYGPDSGQEEYPLPRFSGLADDEHRIEVYSVFPNTLILVEPGNQQTIVLRPQDPGVTAETFANYLVSDASQTDDLKDIRREVHSDSTEINDQDAVLLAGLQQSRSMDVGGETTLNEAWDATNRRFQRLWSERLLAGR